MRTVQRENSPEVTSEPNRDRWNEIRERLRVRDRDPVLGGGEPNLKLMPTAEVGLRDVVGSQTGKHKLRLVRRVSRCERQQPRFVLGV
jgi:hypothetical protein